MTKRHIFLGTLCLLPCLFAGCGSTPDASDGSAPDSKQFSIVTDSGSGEQGSAPMQDLPGVRRNYSQDSESDQTK